MGELRTVCAWCEKITREGDPAGKTSVKLSMTLDPATGVATLLVDPRTGGTA